MITKACVVSMLLYRHQLNHIISCFLYSRQDFICIISVLANATTLMGHTNMRLVYPDTFLLVWHNWVNILPFVLLLLWWIPEDTIKQARLTLYRPFGPDGITVHSTLVGTNNMQLVLHLMLDSWCSIWQRCYGNSKTSEIILLTPVLISIPIIEISKD